MELSTLIREAKEIKEAYAALNQRSGHRVWGPTEYAQGLVGDVGDLVKLVMAKEHFRAADNLEEKLAHELGDCLWSLLILADSLGMDLERAFLQTMEELRQRTR
jgi:NTP pyrophosphatase (non-canonical NTP hydrolase)